MGEIKLPIIDKVLPSALGSSSPADLWRSYRSFKRLRPSGANIEGFVKERLLAELSSNTEKDPDSNSDSRSLAFYRCGTQAIYEVLKLYLKKKSLRNPTVAVSAFTCPDVAAACIKAGFSVLPIDIDSESLALRPESISEHLRSKIDVVILSNLYGIPDQLLSLIHI